MSKSLADYCQFESQTIYIQCFVRIFQGQGDFAMRNVLNDRLSSGLILRDAGFCGSRKKLLYWSLIGRYGCCGSRSREYTYIIHFDCDKVDKVVLLVLLLSRERSLTICSRHSKLLERHRIPLCVPSFLFHSLNSHYPRGQVLPAASHYILSLLLLSFVLSSLCIISSDLCPPDASPRSHLMIPIVLCS